MSHKAEVNIVFKSRLHPTFAFDDNVVAALLDFSGPDNRVIRVFKLDANRYNVAFEIYNSDSIEEIHKDIELLVLYVKANCDISLFNSVVWSSQDVNTSSYGMVTDIWKTPYKS